MWWIIGSIAGLILTTLLGGSEAENGVREEHNSIREIKEKTDAVRRENCAIEKGNELLKTEISNMKKILE